MGATFAPNVFRVQAMQYFSHRRSYGFIARQVLDRAELSQAAAAFPDASGKAAAQWLLDQGDDVPSAVPLARARQTAGLCAPLPEVRPARPGRNVGKNAHLPLRFRPQGPPVPPCRGTRVALQGGNVLAHGGSRMRRADGPPSQLQTLEEIWGMISSQRQPRPRRTSTVQPLTCLFNRTLRYRSCPNLIRGGGAGEGRRVSCSVTARPRRRSRW